jgi:transglutaminase-like putative cysteine protease
VRFRTAARVASLGILVALPPEFGTAAEPAAPKSRTFTFTYAGAVTGLRPGEAARVWLPLPPSNGDQDARLLGRELPAEAQTAREPAYGNDVLYFEAKADANGEVPFEVVYRVTRREVRSESAVAAPVDAATVARYLKPDALVPVDGKPLELIKGKDLPKDATAAARVLYDTVNGHLRYSKEGTGWGRGDAARACESGRGNCSDFHSLFISLARSRQIPAKFEIGFPLPEKRGAGEVAGYHCWAKFLPPGKGWVPVDISEANKNPSLREYYFGNLSENRVCLSTGRDLELVPKQDGPPLNFFVYPYAEVAGKPYPQEKVRTRVSFADRD